MPSDPKRGPNCSGLGEGSGNGGSGSERVIAMARKGQWQWPERGDNDGTREVAVEEKKAREG